MNTVDKVGMIKRLREETGYGLMETKRALEQNYWNYAIAYKKLMEPNPCVMSDSHWQSKGEFTWL